MMAGISNVFGSVMVRLALIFTALAALIAAVVAISWIVFQSIATNMQTLSDERIPELRNSANTVVVADRVRALLSSLLIAETPEDLARLNFKKQLVVADMEAAIEVFPEENRTELSAIIAEVETGLTQLGAARQDEFTSLDGVAATIFSATEAAQEISSRMGELTAQGYLDLSFGSQETIDFVDDTLTTLVDVDFANFQAALSARAEVNLISGLALSISQSRDTALVSILNDLGLAANERLSVVLGQLAGNDLTVETAQQIVPIQEALMQVVKGDRFALTSNEIVSLRQDFDALLSTTLDDIYFELAINSEDAKTNNADAISALFVDQVEAIQSQSALELAVNILFQNVMMAALSRDEAELADRSEDLQAAAALVRSSATTASPEVQEQLNKILAFADAETGIASIRQSAFEAQSTATKATTAAADSVRKIATEISEYSGAAQDKIANSATTLNENVSRALAQIQTIAMVSLGIILLAPVLIWVTVTKPLNRVTTITERLASGDLSEITGLDRHKGEIGRMAKALKVFRSGALERIEMQEAEKKRETELRDAELAAERAKQAAQLREQRAEEERAREQRAAEQAEKDREEKQRAALEAVEKQRAAEQALVVSELANSLKSLSEGDLTRTISTEFPGEYEQLRQDYNSAIGNLAHLIQQIGKSAGLIDSGSAEIAASSLDLSRRTENAAATLEETAAALSELTASVSSAARGASEATETVDTVKQDAEESQKVMTDAVHAMDQIDTSSSEIAKIVEVIDSIAFQTNLLALNAGVEAARAGDAGRGFAVVASEVRILAHRCSDAAEQINKLISESSTHVQEGVSLIDQANEALATILAGIRNMSKNVSEIAVSAQEQSTGITEINVAVEQLDRSTQQNAAMFEETTAASQSLTSEAGQLSNLVAGFHVDHTSVDVTLHTEVPSIAKTA